jgi:hypothetical protein
MMEKVKLTKEQAEALEEVRKEYGNIGVLIHHCGFGGVNWGFAWGKGESLNELTVDEMARALYVGYEIDEEGGLNASN